MSEEQPILIALPRFSRWMKRLSIYVAGIWLVQVLLRQLFHGGSEFGPLHWLALSPSRIVPHYELWRIVSYALIENPHTFGAVWTILSLWWFGSPVERSVGPRRLAEIFTAAILGGAIAVIVVSRLAGGEMYSEPVVGMAPVTAALVAAWGFTHAEQRVSPFGLGNWPTKYVAAAFCALTVVMAITSRSATGIATIGGLAAGAAFMAVMNRRAAAPKGKGGGRARKTSGSRFRVLEGGRADEDKKMWN